MILMQAPAPNLTFGAMPSGATYVSDAFGLVKILNNSSADQVALQGAGCFTLTPFGGWGTFGFNLLSDLLAADTGTLLPGITGFPQHTVAAVFNDSTPSNDGTWVKTGAGSGAGNWSQISTQTMASLSAQIASQASTINSHAAAITTLQNTVASLTTQLDDLGASSVAYSDTHALGATNVQGALDAIYGLLPSLTITGTPPATGSVGTAYDFIPATAGGKAPLTFTLGGTAPPGLSFSTSTGELSGTPTTAGTYAGLSISVRDANGHTAQLAADPFTITITGVAAPSADFTQSSNSMYVAALAA